MSSLLEQFIGESRDILQKVGTSLLDLESAPGNADLMNELFRLVHTLKGSSGLFDLPEMTRVLHAGEDLMDAVRDGRVSFSQELADQLLDAMDFVGLLIDELGTAGTIGSNHALRSNEQAASLRALVPSKHTDRSVGNETLAPGPAVSDCGVPEIRDLPEAARIAAWRLAVQNVPLHLLVYRPDDDCFFKGEDPFHQARSIPGLVWGAVRPRTPWPTLLDFNCYQCQLDFHLLVAAPLDEITEFFRYTPEQIRSTVVDPDSLLVQNDGTAREPADPAFLAQVLHLLEANDMASLQVWVRDQIQSISADGGLASILRWLLAVIESQPENTALQRRLIDMASTATPASGVSVGRGVDAESLRRIEAMCLAQIEILNLAGSGPGFIGRLQAVAMTLKACLLNLGESVAEVDTALAESITAGSAKVLRDWLINYLAQAQQLRGVGGGPAGTSLSTPAAAETAFANGPSAAGSELPTKVAADTRSAITTGENELTSGRRAEEHAAGKILKVDYAKVDRLMNLIGEMVVAKNSLPYLANRAESQYSSRELSREIKAQYAVINRIVEEMQDAIMQVRMTPVSFIFQRFPRLVRDLSRKLGKEVELVLEGEETEADKNIVEALADPLIHIVRNSLDHGLETPDVRAAANKPRVGRLIIRALQEADHVSIEITDDGRGIDPLVIKRKAYDKGLIDEGQLERISDHDALELIFAPGFSTAEAITDLSGRGVGMDVVRTAIGKVGGTVELQSQVGKGTTLRLSLPLSMAVTNVMIIESDQQIFGVPMNMVVETVRLARDKIRDIKQRMATVLRGRIVPLVALNQLLAVNAEPQVNTDGELAALVVRVGTEQIGLLVDDFHEVVDVILKPLPGDLGKLNCYAGSALLGDGSVLMVLDPKELFA